MITKHKKRRTASLKRIVLLALLLFSNPCFSQSEDDDETCAEPTHKKIIKLLEAATDKKKQPTDRFHALLKTIEINDRCARCYFELGMSAYRKAKSRNTTYNHAIGYLEEVLTICPKFHSDVQYTLGVMHYAQSDHEKAHQRFTEFLAFTDGEDWRHSKKWAQKTTNVKEILPELEFYKAFYGNPQPFEPSAVNGVCSPYDDYLPMLTPDNEFMYFTRKMEYKDKGGIVPRKIEELTVSSRKTNGKNFSEGTKMPRPFNVDNNYGGITFSVDNKEMYITICKPVKLEKGGTYNNCDIYYSHYTLVNGRYEWTEPENLGDGINGETSWESQPTLSGDGKTLFYAKVSNHTDQTDIYYTTRENHRTDWTAGQPLSAVNTKGNDKSPFIHSDSQTLYFSSDGHWGAGGLDVFYSRYENNTWTVPQNMGYPINTKEDEVGMFVSTDGRLAYFSSSRLKGARGYDVYAFDLYKKARPKQILMMKGAIRNEEGKVVTDAKVELKYTQSLEVQEVSTDTLDGRYVTVINMAKGEDVIMTVKKKGHVFNSRLISVETLNIDTTKTVVAEMEEIKVEKVKVGKPFRINDIQYETSSALLTRQDKIILDAFAGYLKENERMQVAIHGHTDNRGDDVANLVLSKERAFNVKEYLEKQGIDGSRLKWEGFGETHPIADNETAAGRAKNRRTEFVILSD